MDAWKKWVIVVAGLVSVIGQFWGSTAYLPLIGGAVTVIVGLLLE